MTKRETLIGRLERNVTFFHSLLDGSIIRMEDVLLDELQRSRPLQKLVAEAVGQLGPLQLPLLVAQRRVNSGPNVFEDVSVNELLSVGSSGDLRLEEVVHLCALQLLLLLVQRWAGLRRWHDALLHQRCHRPPYHQLHFQR